LNSTFYFLHDSHLNFQVFIILLFYFKIILLLRFTLFEYKEKVKKIEKILKLKWKEKTKK